MSEIKNATISSVSLGFGDRGFLDCWLMLDYGDCGAQGFGGFTLYLPKGWTHHDTNSPAGHHLYRCMEVAGVTEWKDMVGRTIRVRVENGLIAAIGHITKNDWYEPVKEMQS